MEAVVRRVLHVIQDCVRHANITDLNDVDRICLNLARCSAELGDLLNCVLVTRCILLDEDNISALRELHVCVNHLAVEWETRLLRVSNSETPSASASGRPRVAINIPLVKLKFLLVDPSDLYYPALILFFCPMSAKNSYVNYMFL